MKPIDILTCTNQVHDAKVGGFTKEWFKIRD